MGGEIRALASRYTLSRENSNFSTGNTSYYSAVQYQPSLDENVTVQPCDTRPPIISDVPELYAPYSITTASHVQDGSTPLSMILIPVARPRPRRLILDIETACAQGAEFDRLQDARTLKDEKTTAITNFKLELAAGQSVGVAIEPSALETYLAQSREAERWDIKAWVRDNIAAEECARIAVPKPLRQCEAYYKMKNFNPLNLHKLDPAEGEQQYKNMAVALAQARRNCRPLEVRRMELARMEEARMAEACLAEEAGMVEARTTGQAHEVNNSHINEESELDGDLQRQGVTNPAASLAKSGTISGTYKPIPFHFLFPVLPTSNSHLREYANYNAITGKPRARKLRSAGLGLVRSNVRKGMRMVAGKLYLTLLIL